VLLAHVLGIDRARIGARLEERLDPARADRYDRLVAKRADRVPLAYLTGYREFWSLDLEVTPEVLIPRPETEHVVERSLELLRGAARPVIADVGTGAGPIAVALARELPGAEVHAIDLSPGALEVCRRNAERHGVAERMRFHAGDALDPLLREGLAGRIDLVASNPPYVARGESVQEEVRRWEPALAVFAGEAGDEVIARLVPQAAEALRPGGGLVVEISLPRLERVREILDAGGCWAEVTVTPDLAGLPRVVSARRRMP
jgi:release factor glutamine methyltransferase